MSEAGRYAPQESSRQCAIRELAGLLKPSEKAKYTIGRQQRRARQDAYRRELDEQVADEGERRKGDARKIREIEGRHELQSVSLSVVAYKTSADTGACIRTGSKCTFNECPIVGKFAQLY